MIHFIQSPVTLCPLFYIWFAKFGYFLLLQLTFLPFSRSIDEGDFYGLFIAGLLESQSYRVILAAHTADGLVDFMLVGLRFAYIVCISLAFYESNWL